MKSLFFLAMWLLPAVMVLSKPVFPVMEYMGAFQKALTDCDMQYRMNCAYPDGTKLSVQGRMGVKGNYYFDSSNARFVLFNDRWEIVADHLSKIFSVADVSMINRKFHGIGTLTPSSYLFGNDFVPENLRLTKIREAEDTVWFRVVLEQQTIIKKFEVAFLRSAVKLASYVIAMDCPAATYDKIGSSGGGSVTVSLHVDRIAYPAPAWLFSEDRVFEKRGKKFTLKKFNGYKAYLSNPQNSKNERR